LHCIILQFAQAQGVEGEKALTVGMVEKAKEFVVKGSQIYPGDLPDKP
jgi:hypothetical protein